MAFAIQPISAQNREQHSRPEGNISAQEFRPPRVIKLGSLTTKDIRSSKFEITAPDEITLPNLQKETVSQPPILSISWDSSNIRLSETQAVEFQKFRERSAFNLSKLDSDQGLISDLIQDLVQDSLGNWWFGTANKGLIYYDGQTQRKYDTNNGLSSNLIHVLHLDRYHRLWIGSDKGLDIFDGHRIRTLNSGNGLPNDNIWAFHEDQNHNVWVATEGGLVLIHRDLTKLQNFTTKQGLPSNKVWHAISDSRGQLWVGTESGLSIISNLQDEKFDLTQVVTAKGRPIDNIWSLAEDQNGDIWMGSNGYGILHWRMNSNTVRVFHRDHGLSSDWIWNIYPASDGSIYFGTYGNGIIHYDNRSGEEVFSRLDTEEGITNNFTLKITEDESGTVWIGTDGGGINVLHNQTGIIKNYSEHTGLNEKFVQCIFRDSEGLLWMGTEGSGMNIIDERNGKVTYLSEKDGLSYNSVWAIVEDHLGQIWLGTEQGLSVYNKEKGTIVVYDTLSGLRGMIPWTMLRDHSDRIWIGTSDGGLNRFDPKTQSFKHYQEPGLLDHSIMGLSQDQNGALWIGTRGAGLFRILDNENGEHIQQFRRPEGLSGDSITYLYIDSKARVWAGTQGQGVIYFDANESDPVFHSLASGQGLSHDEVWSIIEDDYSRIWIGTVDRITILNFEGNKPQVAGYLSTDEGLKSNDLNPSSVFKEANGNVIWATIKGPSVVDPSIVNPETTKLDVLVTGLELQNQFVDYRNQNSILINGKEVNLEFDKQNLVPNLNAPSGIELPHEISSVRVNFTPQNAHHIKAPEFQYQLKGVVDNWIITETPNSLLVNNLQSGKYDLAIRARVPGGEWGEPTYFYFSISTPWWETWFARISLIILLVIGLYLFYILRTRSLMQSKLFLEEKVRQRTTELEKSLREVVEARKQLIHSERMASLGLLSSGIAHELSNPISAVFNSTQLIKRDFEDLINNIGDADETKDNIQLSLNVLEVASNQTREIVRGLTNYSRIESKEMILGDVHQCIDNSIMLIQSKLTDVVIEKNYNPAIPLVMCYYTELTQVFLNLLSNALDAIQEKPEPQGLIKIATELDKRFVKISISDNGIGMSLETSQSVFKSFYTSKEPGRGTGLGLAISQSIIEKHAGSIRFETERNVGTTFTTFLPVEQ